MSLRHPRVYADSCKYAHLRCTNYDSQSQDMAEEDPAIALFGTEDFNLYDTLSLSKDASPSDIKSAYRRAALRCHPDKQSPAASEQEKQSASTKFQQVGYAYAVLSDADRRKKYDATGSTEVSLFPENADAWQSYFEELWSGQVNAQSIDDFFAKYIGGCPPPPPPLHLISLVHHELTR